MPYYGETGRQVGGVKFKDSSAGNFNLLIGDDLALCNGMNLPVPVLYDAGRKNRDEDLPEIGAFELENKIIWTGLTDQNWSEPGNWNINAIPGSSSNVVIKPALFNPVIDINQVIIRGMLLKSGSSLVIPQDKILEQSQGLQ
jgi:hypothetical protein